MRRTFALLKSSSSNRWLARQAQDPFVRGRAAGDLGLGGGSAGLNLRARSGFKLAELAKKHRGLLHGRAVVDLGAAPGGWTQVAAAAISKGSGRDGGVVAVDLLPMEAVAGAQVVQGDFFDPEVQAQVRAHLVRMAPPPKKPRQERRGFGLRTEPTPDPEDSSADAAVPDAVADTVLSDMMAAMSGMRARDVQASLDLVSAATEFAHQVLRPAKQSTEAESAADSGASNGLDAEADGRKQPNKPKRYPGGSLVLKFFLHPDLIEFRKTQLEPCFARVVTEKPKASRSESSEAYWVCLGYKGRQPES